MTITIAKPDYAANMALFLLEKTGSIFGNYRGRMNAKEQRELFGCYLGKGEIEICGEEEMVRMRRTTCYGLLFEIVDQASWAELS